MHNKSIWLWQYERSKQTVFYDCDESDNVRSLNYFKIDNYYEIICDFLIEKEFWMCNSTLKRMYWLVSRLLVWFTWKNLGVLNSCRIFFKWHTSRFTLETTIVLMKNILKKFANHTKPNNKKTQEFYTYED